MRLSTSPRNSNTASSQLVADEVVNSSSVVGLLEEEIGVEALVVEEGDEDVVEDDCCPGPWQLICAADSCNTNAAGAHVPLKQDQDQHRGRMGTLSMDLRP